MALDCASGHFLSGGVCTACGDTNADNCWSTTSTGVSLGCKASYYLSSAGTCTTCGSAIVKTCIVGIIATNC